ncbi:ACT domain-containing protein [Acidianus manzaensis]|uniref:Uncharacterized protein n=1 Tax=Acidianus manzaensis TaxID=282676 RepID=A0A1W6K1C5_9CREN|nr:ACT domain-containing protein [Acidianus manzaensis]ARM76309.1 hypothetical protein B6F84_09910 [Acidianus manzaensis]
MTQEKIVKVIGYYRDPGFLERIISNFRKLWVDIDWMTARKINDEGLYEVYLSIRNVKNTELAILNLSKTVDIEKVEVLEDGKLVKYYANEKGEISSDENEGNIRIFVPVYSKVTTYSWGEKSGS